MHRANELPETPELVVLCVPAAHLGAVVIASLGRGTCAFLATTAGIRDREELKARYASPQESFDDTSAKTGPQ